MLRTELITVVVFQKNNNALSLNIKKRALFIVKLLKLISYFIYLPNSNSPPSPTVALITSPATKSPANNRNDNGFSICS